MDKFFLAPLHGYTCPVFRKTFASMEPETDGIVPPFIVAGSQINYSEEYLRNFLKTPEECGEVVPQIMGSEEESFIKLASTLTNMGYRSVNWNIGCPFHKITRKFRGAMVLSDPAYMDRFLSRVVPALPCSLSIKTRTGIDNHSELGDLIRVFNKYPLESLIIHPRTAAQKYEGHADTEAFMKAMNLYNGNLIYNGDINSVADYNIRREKFGDNIDSWMIGRGLIANPFLIKSIKNNFIPGNEDFESYYNLLFDNFSANSPDSRKLLNVMKGYWSFFKDSFGEKSEEVFKRIYTSDSVSVYLDRVRTITENFSFTSDS